MSDALDTMRQSTLNLLTIATSHSDHDATAVMSGLMRLERQITGSIETLSSELRAERRAEPVFEAMNAPLATAGRYGADDLVAVTRRAYRNFDRLVDTEGVRLTSAATKDAMAWIQIATQTRIATRLLFQAATLYGRAPNGKKIEIEE